MVCHQTYKDKNNNWLSPDEVLLNEDNTFSIKNRPNENVTVGPSESMSKSKKNIIDPAKMIEAYGADAVRFFILSDSPPEKDVQWSDTGMASSYKYIQKFWSLNEKILSIISKVKTDEDKQIDIFVNQSINKINFALENFRYNVIIALFHEVYSFFNKLSEKNLNYSNLKENYKKILLMMLPITPHIANECLDRIKISEEDVKWPDITKEFIENKTSKIVIQINGKKRSIIEVERNLDENSIINKIKTDKLVDKYIAKKEIFKTIYIKDRIINFIIK